MAKRSGPRTATGDGVPDDRPLAPRVLQELPQVDLATIDDGDLRDVELRGSLPAGFDEPLMLSGVRLVGVSLVGASLAGSRFIDVEILGSDLSGADLEGAAFTRVAARDARLSGVQLAWATWHDVHLVECRLDGVNLARLTAHRLRAERCSCPGADLRMAKLHGAAWWDCDLSGVDVNQVQLERVQLHGSRLDALSGALSLRPVEVDDEQFHVLAQHLMTELGITVTARPEDDT
jgi:uncharacterized protein YjbI with pentapeptide repeats